MRWPCGFFLVLLVLGCTTSPRDSVSGTPGTPDVSERPLECLLGPQPGTDYYENITPGIKKHTFARITYSKSAGCRTHHMDTTCYPPICGDVTTNTFVLEDGTEIITNNFPEQCIAALRRLEDNSKILTYQSSPRFVDSGVIWAAGNRETVYNCSVTPQSTTLRMDCREQKNILFSEYDGWRIEQNESKCIVRYRYLATKEHDFDCRECNITLLYETYGFDCSEPKNEEFFQQLYRYCRTPKDYLLLVGFLRENNITHIMDMQGYSNNIPCFEDFLENSGSLAELEPDPLCPYLKRINYLQDNYELPLAPVEENGDPTLVSCDEYCLFLKQDLLDHGYNISIVEADSSTTNLTVRVNRISEYDEDIDEFRDIVEIIKEHYPDTHTVNKYHYTGCGKGETSIYYYLSQHDGYGYRYSSEISLPERYCLV